ncbi:hypothetical protein [Clostridium senegalense]|nr:hypothetical protein [Clostridium senegalense]
MKDFKINSPRTRRLYEDIRINYAYFNMKLANGFKNLLGMKDNI